MIRTTVLATILATPALAEMPPLYPPNHELTIDQAMHVEGKPACGATFSMLSYLSTDYSETLRVTTHLPNGEAYFILMNSESGSWTVGFTLNSQGTACFYKVGNIKDKEA